MADFSPPNLVGFADIRTQAIDDWQEYRQAGRQFLDLAETAFRNKNAIFTTTILYNLIAMAIEKLVMSRLMALGRLPYNHTMHDLVAALEEWRPAVVQGMAASLRALDSYQEICDPYTSTSRTPTPAEIESMLGLARQLEQRLETDAA
ncbi:hypothetical protein [Desulfobulbus elongatus]|uniref:hypothetical protein n=1 Tax=Desulfobulbus elongatus TaxID=53332 RepID=UPI000480BD33|nr:hypothetical protein [Desulfobulbus elongatus]